MNGGDRPAAVSAVSGGPTIVYLHVGAPKTGTTYLQDVLWRNKGQLARDGVLYPAGRPAEHFHAAQDLRGVRFHGYDNPAVAGAWERVAAQVRRWRGPGAVISHELLAWATEEQAQRAVESLRPAEVHVVYTARDLARQIPAVWQETVKNRRLVGFGRYLRSLAEPESRAPWGRGFWAAQDAVDVLRRWGTAVPAERVHVVTVPHPGGPPGVLWARFAGLLGLDPDRYDSDVQRSNASLGRAEVELLRRVNRALGDEIDWPTYELLFKRGLAETVLAGRSGTQKVVLPRRWHPWVLERSQRVVKGLRDGGYGVVGDLEELLPGEPHPDAPRTPAPQAGPDAQLSVAAETIAQLVKDRGAGASAPSRTAWRRLALTVGRRAARLGRQLHLRR